MSPNKEDITRDISTTKFKHYNGLVGDKSVSESEKLELAYKARGFTEERIQLIQSLDFTKIDVSKVSLDIVDGCNLRCIGCPNSIDKPTVAPIPIELIIKRIKNINVRSIGELRLYRFGEPLFNKNLPELLKTLKDLNSPRINNITLSTNGQHKNFHILENSLRTGCIDSLGISADGDGSKEVFEAMRPPAKWNILVDFIREARSIIENYNLQTLLTMGITLPPEKLYKDQYLTKPRTREAWKSKFAVYIDRFDFHPLINMPGSLISEQNLYKDQEYYAPRKDSCKSLLGSSIYVDGKGIVQPCCWASSVANLGDLNHYKLSDILAERILFSHRLDHERNLISMCNICHSL